LIFNCFVMKGFDFVFRKLAALETDPWMDTISLKRGQSLIVQGQLLNNLFWVASGLLREYHENGDEEFTNSFIAEGNYYLTGFYFGGKIKSSFTVEALEESRILILSMDFFQQDFLPPKVLLDVFKEVLTIKYQHNLQWKLINGKKSFLEKWEYFKESNPGLWIRIPQKHLATYFNVTPQYISQLKAKRKL
jgi:CRP-like cAMP-binding protein